MQYFLFTVNAQSWPEHLNTGIAAINDPGFDPDNRQGNAQRQKALCEVASICKGDYLFFYYQQGKKLMGLFEAISTPFYEKKSLIRRGYIDSKFPIRVAFKQKINFREHLDMDDVWYNKDKGYFWSIQQQRGNSVGRHACICLTKQDGERLLRMFFEKNPVPSKVLNIKNRKHGNKKLPLDCTAYETELHYEAVLQAILLREFRNGKHKTILGDYDYCVPFFPTSSQKEIDIILFRHERREVLWYEILELKQSHFNKGELNKLMDYENWLIRSLAINERCVHTIGIANRYDDEVKEYIKRRSEYGGKNIRLITYKFNKPGKSITLEEA